MPPLPRTLHRLARTARTYATSTPGAPAFQVFNNHSKLLQKTRAARSPQASHTDYLRTHIATDLLTRLSLITRPFPHILDLGSGACHVSRVLSEHPELRAKVTKVTAVDTCPAQLHRDESGEWEGVVPTERVEIAPDAPLPFEDGTFDAVVSGGSLHWVNDLPGILREAARVLKPDAPFVAGMFGGDTLFELRTSLQLAEMERYGGVSPRVSPMVEVKDMGGMLDKAGFGLVTVDVDDVIVGYPGMVELLEDLRGMGEGNAVLGRKEGQISRGMLMAAEGIYKELHCEEGEEGVPATWRVVYMVSGCIRELVKDGR